MRLIQQSSWILNWLEKAERKQRKFSVSQQSYLCTGVQKFLLDISAVLELHRAKRIASDFNTELKRIRKKYRNVGFPLKFINETIWNFERGKEEIIIPEWLFDERKTFSVRFPYSPVNEKFSKVFTRKVENFTNDKVNVIIIRNPRKMQSLFNNKAS